MSNFDNVHIPPDPRDQIKQIIVMTRLNLYNRNQPCGARAIREEIATYPVKPLPSLSLISRTLNEYGLTHRRTGNY